MVLQETSFMSPAKAGVAKAPAPIARTARTAPLKNRIVTCSPRARPKLQTHNIHSCGLRQIEGSDSIVECMSFWRIDSGCRRRMARLFRDGKRRNSANRRKRIAHRVDGWLGALFY